MLSSNLPICRLCMTSNIFTNLYKMDKNMSLYTKISYCIDIKILPGDSLPSLICTQCETNINNFYEFKQRCIEVDSKLRTTLQGLPSKQDRYSNNTDIKTEYELVNEFYECVKDTSKSCLNKDSVENNNIMKIEFETEKECYLNIKYGNKNKSDSVKYVNNKTGSKVNNEINNIFQCEICGRILKHKAIFKKHLISHSGIKQFSCKLCPKKFTRAEHKIVHMRSHMGIKPFICEICGKASRKRQDLMRHLRVHSEEKKYACPHCERRFKRSSDVSSHLRTHTGAKPYTCHTCEKSYSSHSGLRKHYKSHCKKEPST